jgi:hypothetical protein
MGFTVVMLAVVARHHVVTLDAVEGNERLSTVEIGIAQRVVVGIYRNSAVIGQNGHLVLP